MFVVFMTHELVQSQFYVYFYTSTQMKKFDRETSSDKLTVRKNSQPMSFPIYYQDDLVLTLSLYGDTTVGQFLDTVKVKLGKRFQNIVGLCTVDGQEIADYTLTLKNYKVSNYHPNQGFRLLMEEVVTEFSMPTITDFTFLKCIGEGISAHVYLVRHNSNGNLYALKQIKKEYFQDFKRLQQVLREKKIMTDELADLPFVTKLYASFQSQKHLNFLLEYYPGGELFFHLQTKKFSEDQAKLCFAQILTTFEELHKRKIIYRDLKPENIMIDFDGHLRLGDFGLCKINVQKSDLSYSYCGSPEYMPPETKQSSGYSFTADFYTMGALIYEMVRGVPPYYENSPLDFPEGLSEDFIQIVTKLIDDDPAKRLSDFNSVRKLKWLKKIEWQKVMKKQLAMPIKILPYNNYTHEEFKAKHVDSAQLREQERYDHLFGMFYFLSNDKKGIAQFYPSNGLIKTDPTDRVTKSTKIQRSRTDRTSHSIKSSNMNKSKSISVKENEVAGSGRPFKRKSIKTPNIYEYNSPIKEAAKKSANRSKVLASAVSATKKPVQPSNHISPKASTLQIQPLKFNKLSVCRSAKEFMPKQFEHAKKN